jgi:hypothetical protein
MKLIDRNLHAPMPKGIVYAGTGPIRKVTKDLLIIAAFLQELSMFGSPTLLRYDDWWEHDDCHFKKGKTDLHELFTVLQTPRCLFESMSGDDRVFIGLGPEDESWYLRFYADWDSADEEIVAAYAIALLEGPSQQFREKMLSKLICSVETLDTETYFARIIQGECSI